MLHIPIARWGEPYKSLEADKVVHFVSGETLAEVSRANAALVERDMRHAGRARAALREIPIRELLQMVKKFADVDEWEMEFEDVSLTGNSSPNRR